jgi:hypothetical protein
MEAFNPIGIYLCHDFLTHQMVWHRIMVLVYHNSGVFVHPWVYDSGSVKHWHPGKKVLSFPF